MANLELHPFQNATLTVAKYGKNTIIYFSHPDVPVERVALYTVQQYGNSWFSDTYHIAHNQGSINTFDATKHILAIMRKKYAITPVIYVISRNSLEELVRAKLGDLAESKKQVIKSKKSSHTARSLNKKEFACIQFNSGIIQKDSYEIKVQYVGTPYDATKFAPLSILLAQEILGFPKNSEMLWETKNKMGYKLDYSLHVTAADDMILLKRLEDEIRQDNKIDNISHQLICKTLMATYSCPTIATWLNYINYYPTDALYEKNGDAILEEANKILDNTLQNIENCWIQIAVPYIPSEEALRILSRAEMIIDPSIMDREIMVTRKESEQDPLFDKLYTKIDDLYEEKVPSKKKDVIKFTYGNMLDAGQVFTYNEISELSGRAILLE